MKTRIGFVSNSSSSSFIIHRRYITDSQIKELEKLYDKLKNSPDPKEQIYDDLGRNFIIEENYIWFTAYGGYDKLKDLLLNKFRILDIQILKIYH